VRRSAVCGQRGCRKAAVLADCLHRATVDSSDFSVCSVKRSRQTPVAVIILAAALGTDKASLPLSHFLQTKSIILYKQQTNSTAGGSDDDAGLYKIPLCVREKNKHLEKLRYRTGNIIKIDLSYGYRELCGV